MEDHIRTAFHELAARVLARDVERVSINLAGEARRSIRRNNVDQREPVDRLAIEAALGDEPIRELAPDHAGRPGDENVHKRPSPEFPFARGLHRAWAEGKEA